ncbi:SGNH/GDSL hydrolase family protein [Flindersiella endophytica]
MKLFGFSRLALAAVPAVALLAAAVPSTAAVAGDRHSPWSATWGTAVQNPMAEWSGPNWAMPGFADQSVRQVVRVSTGGPIVRVRLSNLYGTGPLRIAGATIAKTAEGAAVEAGSVRQLRFGHSRSTTVAAGSGVASDAVALRVGALEKLTVTLYFANPTGPTTYHEGAFATSYRADGDHRSDVAGTAYAGETNDSWYFLDGIDVLGGTRGTVVAFGDSITDGYFTTRDANNSYPDELAERLTAAGKRIGVDNEGIGGNKVLTDSVCLGEKGVTRIFRDVVRQPGVRSVIILEGINDIGMSAYPADECGPSLDATAEQIIDGHRTMIRAAHAHGITAIGATLTPIKGSFYDTPANEAKRDAVNHWIRTSGEYDAVADFDRAVSNPADPDAILPTYDGGDALHPNDAGMKAMAAAVPLGAL